MLTIVMAKPMQLTMVSAEPRDSSGASRATRVENNGESAMTTHPQKDRKVRNAHRDPCVKNKGESRQHKPEKNSAQAASFLG